MTRIELFKKHPYCFIAYEKYQIIETPTEIHHARIHNTKWAKLKYPNFLNSVFNLKPVSHKYHMENPSYGKWPEWRIAIIERGLMRHKLHQKYLCYLKY